jgi:hypothetical protein
MNAAPAHTAGAIFLRIGAWDIRMDEPSDNVAKWGWGFAAPIVLWVLAAVWLLSGEVRFTGRSGETVYRSWGLWSCSGAVFFFGLRLFAEHFLSRFHGKETAASAVSLLAGWLAGTGLVGCAAWVIFQIRP